MTFSITPQPVDPNYGEALLPLSDAKAHLRLELDDDAEDALIEQLRDAAIDFVEQYTNVKLGPVTGEASFDGFGRLALGIGPAASFVVTGIGYDWGGQTNPLAAGSWRVDAMGEIRSTSTWPRLATSVSVAFTAGYPDGTCPPALIAAAKLVLGHFYANREAVVTNVSPTELPLGAKALCDRYRMPVL